MKVKNFVSLGNHDDYIRILDSHGEELLKGCSISDYLKMKKPINGNIKNWMLDVVCWDYPMINITIE